MESDSALHGDVLDGAEVSPSADNQQETAAEISENNGTEDESGATTGIYCNKQQIAMHQ